jgi:hypothetical protein
MSAFLTVTVAPAMTAPDESCTTPEIVPVVTCENREKENSNTPRIAPSTLMAFPARVIFKFKREFIAPPFSNARKYLQTLEKAAEEKAAEEKVYELWLCITLPGEEVKVNRRVCQISGQIS